MPLQERGNKLACWCIALGIVVLVTVGILYREALVEQWYIFRLRSNDEVTRLTTAEKLAEMKSVRAVPHLLRLIKEDEREKGRCGAQRVLSSDRTSSAHYWAELTRLSHTVYRIGAEALPYVKESMDSELTQDGSDLDLRFVSTLSALESALLRLETEVRRVEYGDFRNEFGNIRLGPRSSGRR